MKKPFPKKSGKIFSPVFPGFRIFRIFYTKLPMIIYGYQTTKFYRNLQRIVAHGSGNSTCIDITVFRFSRRTVYTDETPLKFFLKNSFNPSLSQNFETYQNNLGFLGSSMTILGPLTKFIFGHGMLSI